MTPRILFQGEMQLARWSDSSQNGAMVTFWTHPDDLESFKLLKARSGKQAGQRLGVVMVEIADDEGIVAEPPAATPKPLYPKPAVGKAAMTAVGYCNNADFLRWAAMQSGIDGRNYPFTPLEAKQFVLSTCGISAKYGDKASRKHLDTDGEAAMAFEQKIRRPYAEWLAQEAGFTS
jgi:hypothetical protein